MSYKFIVIIATTILVVLSTGCTTMVPEYPVKGVQTNTIDKTNPNKEITEEAFYLTKEGAKYKLALAREETKRIKAQARAANPCGGCFMVASGCYAYGAPCGGGNGLVVGGREGGHNRHYNSH